MSQFIPVPGPSQDAFNALSNQMSKQDYNLVGKTVYTGDAYSANPGIYRCSSSASNLPVSANGYLSVIQRSNDLKYLEFVTDGGNVWTNTLNGVNWTGWVSLAEQIANLNYGVQPNDNLTSANIGNYTTTGLYVCYADSSLLSINGWVNLFVLNGLSVITQTIISEKLIAFRRKSSGDWTAWKTVTMA